MQKNIWRTVIEVALILFLIYSNLDEKICAFGQGAKSCLAWAVGESLLLPEVSSTL